MPAHPLYELVEVVIVTALVLVCALYCTLRLAPASVTLPIRNALLCLPLPVALKSKLRPGPQATGCGAGCDGCASAAPPQPRQGRP